MSKPLIFSNSTDIIEVKSWNTTDLKPKFKLLPQVTKTAAQSNVNFTQIPLTFDNKPAKFVISSDAERGVTWTSRQGLVKFDNKGDKQKKDGSEKDDYSFGVPLYSDTGIDQDKTNFVEICDFVRDLAINRLLEQPSLIQRAKITRDEAENSVARIYKFPKTKDSSGMPIVDETSKNLTVYFKPRNNVQDRERARKALAEKPDLGPGIVNTILCSVFQTKFYDVGDPKTIMRIPANTVENANKKGPGAVKNMEQVVLRRKAPVDRDFNSVITGPKIIDRMIFTIIGIVIVGKLLYIQIKIDELFYRDGTMSTYTTVYCSDLGDFDGEGIESTEKNDFEEF